MDNLGSWHPIFMTGNVTKPKACSVFITLMLLGQSAFAYDSSGGQKISEIISTVQFVEMQSSDIAPILIPNWNQPDRTDFLGELSRVLAKMPLDVIDIPKINHVSITNSACAFPLSDSIKPISRDDYDFLLLICGPDDARWQKESQTLFISASVYLAKVLGRESGQTNFFPEVVLHELTHAWVDSHKEIMNDFYAIRYKSIAEQWRKEKQTIERSLEEQSRLIDLQKGEEINETCNQYISETPSGKDFSKFNRCVNELYGKRLYESHKYFEKLKYDALVQKYKSLHYPSRLGISGRAVIMRNITFDGYDMHSLENEEYLPCLVELMWADPELAAAEYSSEEMAWVKHTVFKDHTIVPWQDEASAQNSVAGSPKLTVDLKRQFDMVQNLKVAGWDAGGR